MNTRRQFLITAPMGVVGAAVEQHRSNQWRQHVKQVNWELFDRGVETFTWYALEETVKAGFHERKPIVSIHGKDVEPVGPRGERRSQDEPERMHVISARSGSRSVS